MSDLGLFSQPLFAIFRKKIISCHFLNIFIQYESYCGYIVEVFYKKVYKLFGEGKIVIKKG